MYDKVVAMDHGPVERAGTKQLGHPNVFTGQVSDANYRGGTASYLIDVGGARFQAINAIEEHMFTEGDAVEIRIDPEDCVLLDHRGRRIA